MQAADGEWIETTPGRLILNEALPAEIGFLNRPLGEKELHALISRHLPAPRPRRHREDARRGQGPRASSTRPSSARPSAWTTSSSPRRRRPLIEQANTKVEEIQNQYLQGHITNEERYNRVIEVWSTTNELITNELMETLENDHEGFNPIYMMAHSGARGSRSQIRQLAGMRGLMAKPSGDIIELPIRSNFKEGLSVIEFFISTNGARKGLADTALKTADAGYLTRRLVDIAQDVVINEDDCGTINGIDRRAIKDGEEIVEPLARPHRGAHLARAGQAPDHRRDDRRRERGDHRRDRRGDRGRGHRGGADPLRAHLRRAPRRLRQVLRPQPRHHGVSRDRRGGRHHRRPVHRPAGHAAHHAYLPHRRRGDEDQRGEPDLPEVPGLRRQDPGRRGEAREREHALHPQGHHHGAPDPGQPRGDQRATGCS